MPATRAINSFPPYFSYGVVGGASCLGLLFPGAVVTVLGPILLIGLVVLGLAHGACDHFVLPAVGQVKGGQRSYFLKFVLGYLGLATAAGLGWWHWPGVAVSLFLLLTVWHWGSADAPAQPGKAGVWLTHSVLRGTLLFAVPATWWPTEVQHSIDGLLLFAGAGPLNAALFLRVAHGLWPVVGIGHFILWGYYATQQAAKRWHTDAGEVLLLTILFVTLRPLWALGIYFVFWHSLQHMLRLNRVFGYAASKSHGIAWVTLGKEVAFFIRRALPILLVSLAIPAGLYALLPPKPATLDALLGMAVILAAILTLPHALLVSVALDSPVWRIGKNKLAAAAASEAS